MQGASLWERRVLILRAGQLGDIRMRRENASRGCNRLASWWLRSGESGIRTRGPPFGGHGISNAAHSATLPSLRAGGQRKY